MSKYTKILYALNYTNALLKLMVYEPNTQHSMLMFAFGHIIRAILYNYDTH